MRTGKITIATYPSGAKIYIDDVLVLDDKGEPGLTPAVLTVTTGDHSIKLVLEGYCNEFDNQYVEQDENIEVFRNFHICQ